MRVSVSENGNPFPGLRGFQRDQAHLFFGRDEQIKELIARLRKHRFLPIVGVSGSGKSSLVRAGLIPALTSTYIDTLSSGWRIVVLRPGRNPLQVLAATLSREFAIENSDRVLEILRGSTAGLARVVQEQLQGKEKLLVLVDQFEELFRYGAQARAPEKTNEDAAFVKLLLAATGKSEHPLPGYDDLPVYVVTTMRSDFLGKCSRFRGLPEALNHTQYLISRLTREQQRDVIEGPVGMAGATIEPGLVQQLLNDLGDNPNQLPALQHALMATWEQSAPARKQGNAIAASDYEAVGGMADALNNDADKVYEPLSANDTTKEITRRIFQRLVQPGAADGETRSPTPLSELAAITAADEGALNHVISVFEKRGFLTRSNDPDPIIDITHESLIRGWRQLKTWVDEESRSAVIYRRLVDAADLNARHEGAYFVDPQLQLTLDWRKQNRPNEAWAKRYDSRFDLAMTFLEQSKKKKVDTLRRAQLTALVLGTLLVLAVAATIFAVIQWRQTRAERDRSTRMLYDSNIYFVRSAVASGQIIQARERLNELLEENLRDLRGFEWFYLWRAAHPEEATLSGHSESVTAVAFSPDGKTLASASYDSTLKLWDTTSRKELVTLSGHSESVTSVAFSPDGKTLASASWDKTVKLWDTVSRKELVTLSSHSNYVSAVAFAPDGKTLASASWDKTVKLWDTTSRKELVTLSGHSEFVSAVAFAPDGKTLASASKDKTVKLWDTVSHNELATLGHSDFVIAVAFSPDGKTLASASDDHTVKLWDTATYKELASLSGHSFSVSAVVFSPDGKALASASWDKTVKLWDTTSRKELVTLSGHSKSVAAVAFAPDGKTLASGSYDNTVMLWDTVSRKEPATLSGHSDSVTAVAFSPDGKTLASASYDNTVMLWDTVSRKELVTLSGHSESVTAVAFSPDSKTLASASKDNTVKLWDIVSRRELATLSVHSDYFNAVAFSPDGKTFASAIGRAIKLWDTATYKEVGTLSGDSLYVTAIAFSPDGKTLASAGVDIVTLWNIATRKELATLSGHISFVAAVAFSPDGKTLACTGGDSTVNLWDIASREDLGSLSGHSFSVSAVAFSPDGKTLASASWDKTVKLWDTSSLKELVTLAGHSQPVTALAFSPDGKTLASASGDKTIRLWIAATEEEVEAQRRRGN